MSIQMVGVLSALLFPLADAFAQPRWDDWYGHGMMGWGVMGWLGAVMMLIFWIVIIAAVVILVRWLVSADRLQTGGAGRTESALDILKKRYARGEISKEEFEEKRKDIS